MKINFLHPSHFARRHSDSPTLRVFHLRDGLIVPKVGLGVSRPSQDVSPKNLVDRLPTVLLCISLLLIATPLAHAQLSLSTAVDLAQRNSPKVKSAQAEEAKALATWEESKDIFVPAVTGGANLGDAIGFSTNPPTLFTITAQSLVFSSSQSDYIRSARSAFNAAKLSLEDARESVAQDTALAFVALDHDQKREAALAQQFDDAARLVTIEQDRFDAGRDTEIDLTGAKLTAAQLRLSRLRAEDATAEDRDHLAHLLGLPSASALIAGALPPMPSGDPTANLAIAPITPAVESAFINAHAKQEQAFGDARFLYRPQIMLFLQYNRYATFTDAFKQLSTSYGKVGANEEAFGVQISIPILDKARQARARESAADASHAFQEAQLAQFQELDSRPKLSHSIAELQARAEVARLDQQLAQQQLDALTTQLNTSSSNSAGPQLSPKDEQNSRIAEREKYLTLIEANYELEEAEINLMRQTGQLELWLHQPAAPTSTP
jgi:outer membrane protein TolC